MNWAAKDTGQLTATRAVVGLPHREAVLPPHWQAPAAQAVFKCAHAQHSNIRLASLADLHCLAGGESSKTSHPLFGGSN